MALVLGIVVFLAAGTPGVAGSPKHSPLGPGKGPWPKADPASQGLSAAALDHIAKELAVTLPHRHCLVVVKNGKLVHDSYYSGYDASSLHRTQSLGKTTIAGLMGVAVQKGLLDINKPLMKYGVRSGANWSRGADGTDHFPKVTTKHLLAQSSGFGKVEPGTFFTYDSDEYIQHMSYVLEAISKEAPVDFATREFVDKLGLDHDHYRYDSAIYGAKGGVVGGNISVSGGQMTSCLDMAKVGQLFVNNGKWLDDAGEEMQLIPEEYARQIYTPAYPDRIGYGLLTWLNSKNEAGDPHAGPSPRWGNKFQANMTSKTDGLCCADDEGKFPDLAHCDLNSRVLSYVAESVKNPNDPRALARGGSMGINSSVIDDYLPADYLHPHAPYDMGIGMGQFGQYLLFSPSEKLVIVSMGYSTPSSNDCWKGYNEGFNSGILWGMLSPALQKQEPLPPSESVDPKVAENAGTSASLEREKAAKPVKDLTMRSPEDIVGSCMCDCPMALGFGLCFNVDKAMGVGGKAPSDCKATLSSNSSVAKMIASGANSSCPAEGLTMQCHEGQTTSRCKEMYASPVKPCGPVENMPSMIVETCKRELSGYFGAFNPCVWHASPCNFGAYYPEWQPIHSTSQDIIV